MDESVAGRYISMLNILSITFLVDESEDEATIALAPNVADCESVSESVPVWATELHKNGSYYEGIVADLEETLLHHKKATITTYGTRRSRTHKTEVF